MMDNNPRYYAYRIQLEKLKRGTWLLIVVARFLLFLVIVARYLGQL